LTTPGHFTSVFCVESWPDISAGFLPNLGRIIRPPLKTAKDQKQQDARHPDLGADISAGLFQIWAG
jgi:hypothetical protein